MQLGYPFENRNNELYIEGKSSVHLTNQYGTPLYVYSESKIRDNLNALNNILKKNYSKTRVLYACKANTNLSILRILKDGGAEIDAVSPGEVYLALQAGFKPHEILFTGTSVGEAEMTYLSKVGTRMNIDSVSQLEKLLEINQPETISMRINPMIGAGHHEHVITAGPDVKFGIWETQASEAYGVALEAGVKKFGIQMHIGSGIMDVEIYKQAASRLMHIARNIAECNDIHFDFIDIGGGIGVTYRPEEKQIDLNSFIETIFELIKEKLVEYHLGEPEIWLEPGRYIVADSGILLTKVTTLKQTPGRVFVGVDAGFNTLVRPAMYGAYHHILNASGMNKPLKKYDVYGPLCESGDIFDRDRTIQEIDEGDILAFMTAGAYGYSMASNYNTRPRPAEVMVSGGEPRIIRKRETLEDLIHGQIT
jgi:diaminopimelate decarboxylase